MEGLAPPSGHDLELFGIAAVARAAVALALIPDEAAHGQRGEWGHELAVPLAWAYAAYAPVALQLAGKGRRLRVSLARCPRLNLRAAERGGHYPYRNPEAALERTGKIIARGRHLRQALRPGHGPRLLPAARRYIDAQHRVGGLTQLHLGGVNAAGGSHENLAAAHRVLHIGLSGGHPYLAHHHVGVFKGLTPAFYSERAGRGCGLHGLQRDAPRAVCRRFCPCFLPAEAHRDALAGGGLAPYRHLAALLQHHVRRYHGRRA